tara:strand:- start:1516 stop:2664 length:1149 start_codon:yes stop_codon:yes gene_type:complete
MKFAHLADCHLGSWRDESLRTLNFQAFQYAIDRCIKLKLDFILIAGDLFDSAYPSLDILKEAFSEFKKLYDAGIPVFLIAGSHDYSVSGKSFLDVLEKAGFCKNVSIFEERGEHILLEPTIYKNVAIYGYPGKKSCLEVDEIPRIKLQDSPGLFKILMLHTAIRDATNNSLMKAVDETQLPRVDYLALGHLHIGYNKDGRVYAGATFPNNISELEELGEGSFYIIDQGKIEKQRIKLKEIVSINLEITDALKATDQIIKLLSNERIKDKIVIIRLSGYLQQGKTTDIDFSQIESFALEKGAYTFLKSTTKLHIAEAEMEFSSLNTENMESRIIEKFQTSHPNKKNSLITELIRSLQVEKLEDETTSLFNERLLSETKKVLSL